MERYQGHQQAYQLWKEGIQNHLFIPQFHAREHLNVAEWMRALQHNDAETLAAFEEGLWGYSNKSIDNTGISYQAAFDLFYPQDLPVQEKAIREGLELFEELFGYRATFFVPPNGPFNNSLEKVAAAEGIKYMSCSKIQQEPVGYGKIKKRFHYLGQQNAHRQRYLTRNCFFEPSQTGTTHVSRCLGEIKTAFQWHKPAVISSHRVNYIGALNEANRQQGLSQLQELLGQIVKQWPEVEFYTSNELGDLISTSYNS